MFKRIKGNARGCLIFEPFFSIPFNMYATYASVYMLALGIDEKQIGLLTSICLAVQIFSSFISGYLTDKMGRRAALLVFDIVSWGIATFLWAVAQNFWYFFIAAIVNGFQKIPNTAWYCLLVEDTDPRDRSIVFMVLQLIGVIAGFFAPLGGILVKYYGLVPAMRIMYAFTCISMMTMFFGRNKVTHETEIGKRKRIESSDVSLKDVLAEYGHAIKLIISDKPLMLIFGVYILNNFQITMRSTYLSIYLVNALRLNDALISIFPALSSVAMLALIFFVMPRFDPDKYGTYMLLGFAISAAANIILIFAPIGNIVIVVISTMLAAAGGIIAGPYLEAAVANSIDDENRAKIFSILTVFILVCISPSGIIGGWTYTINPRIPFLLVILAFLTGILLLIRFFRIQKDNQLTVEEERA